MEWFHLNNDIVDIITIDINALFYFISYYHYLKTLKLSSYSQTAANLCLSSLSGDRDLDLDLERESSFRLELPPSLRSLLSL